MAFSLAALMTGVVPGRTPQRMAGFGLLAMTSGMLGGCTAPLSTLDPVGPSAEMIARLWWIMLAGAAAIFALVVGILVYAFWRSDRPIEVSERRWIVGGGLVFPLTTLLALLAYSVFNGERLLPRADPDPVIVDAVARQFQWEFRYPDRPGEKSPILVIPVNRPVDVRVISLDVIHSFWVPRLAGKIDAIPGHVNVLRIMTDRPGVYLGQCAEYCGYGHAGMHLRVEAVPDAEFAGFLSAPGFARLESASTEVAP